MIQLNTEKLTPMMKQYYEIKSNYMDYILFYRLGDFYEMFFDDAIRASRELEITLTARNCGLEEKAPLCGVPYHSVDGYIKKLVERGIKVAICEQVEDPALAKGIVKREVVRIITPGTITDPEMLEAGDNNFVAAFYQEEGHYALAYCDITTGLFKATHVKSVDAILDEIIKIMPSELIFDQEVALPKNILQFVTQNAINTTPFLSHAFKAHASEQIIKRLFNVFSVESLGFHGNEAALCVCGALLNYVEETAKVPLKHIGKIHLYSPSGFMVLDQFTRRNLELTETMRTKEKKGSLLWVIDKTCTAMGARRLKTWLEEPLLNKELIDERLNTVGHLVDDLMLRSDLRSHLNQVYDLERLTSKLVYGSVNPRDLVMLKHSIGALPDIKALIESEEVSKLKTISGSMDLLEDIYKAIDEAIEEEPPMTVKDGGVIKSGFFAELDELREIMGNGKQWILNMEAAEREKTGIKTLKMGFNKVFGYYIEISKGSVKNAPEDYIRKQTLANAERYITPELKTLEEKVLGAEEKINRLEQELFTALKNHLSDHILRIQQTATAVAELDALLSFAEASYRYGFVKPKITSGSGLKITQGRHPVVERIFNDVPFVPNDTFMAKAEGQFYIITGPNMAGKSTYLRQVALITLMAQIGCFVPASKAEIGIVDRIFTRVGASDDLSQGQSTFMVEMNELANILNNATEKSLVILDEIGRGTSTYDGLSIAWSVVEYIAGEGGIGAKTLFATHYHELTELEGRVSGVKNYRIAVKESYDDIVFLRKIEPGGANQSYGIQVAKLAGVPEGVITRAKEILLKLEESDINNNIESLKEEGSGAKPVKTMSAHRAEGFLESVKALSVETMTPIEAMNALYEMVNQAKKL